MKSQNNNTDFDVLVEKSKLQSCFSFNNDLKVGQIGEKYVQTIFGDANVAIEVKRDDWAVKTGNIALEFESRGKPSGILLTKADFYCFVIGYYFVLTFPVDFLKQIYHKYHNDANHTKMVGDRDKNGKPTAKIILLPWVKLLALFKEYQPSLSNGE